MTTTIHTARYNDQVFTRTSKSRTYSHVVLGRDSYELHLAGAQSKGWARTDASNYRWTLATAEGRAEYGWNRTPEAIAKAQAELQGINSVEEYQAAQTARRVADVEARKAAGAFDTYGVIGWTSRLDLAQKLQGQSQARYGHVVIVEAERTTKEPKGQPKAAEAPVATEEAAPAASEDAELLAIAEREAAAHAEFYGDVPGTPEYDKAVAGRLQVSKANIAVGHTDYLVRFAQEELEAPLVTEVVADSAYQVEKLNSEGKHFEAGQMAARLGLYRTYGAHYGMRSTREAARVSFLAGYDAQVSHEDDSAFQDVLLAVVDMAATHEIEVTLEGNQTTKRTPLTMELVKDILRRNGMLNDADRHGNKGLRRLWAALVEGARIHTVFHSYKLVPIEPVKTSQELLAQPWDGILVIEREDTLGLAYREEGLPETTVWLTRDILSKSSSWDGHRSPLITFDALMAGRRIHTSDKSYVLAQEEADEPSDAYQGEEQPPVIDQGDQDAIMAHNDQVIEAWADAEWTLGDLEVIDRPQDALQDAFDRWTEEEATQSWEQRLEAAQTLQERIAIAREVVRAARDAQVTQDELRGLTLVVSGAFVGTNGPKALTVDELHFMAACENQSARKVLERLKAGQVIEGSCTYRYLAEASSNAWAA